jgi:hypothetical protein
VWTRQFLHLYDLAWRSRLHGGFGLIRIPVDHTGQATARRIWRKFEGEPERMIHELPDNVTTKYQDDVV